MLSHIPAHAYILLICAPKHTHLQMHLPPTYSINYTHRHMHMHTQYKHFQKSAAPFLLIHTSACKVAAVFKLLTVNLEMSINNPPPQDNWLVTQFIRLDSPHEALRVFVNHSITLCNEGTITCRDSYSVFVFPANEGTNITLQTLTSNAASPLATCAETAAELHTICSIQGVWV